jgi:hypothetical protein
MTDRFDRFDVWTLRAHGATYLQEDESPFGS